MKEQKIYSYSHLSLLIYFKCLEDTFLIQVNKQTFYLCSLENVILYRQVWISALQKSNPTHVHTLLNRLCTWAALTVSSLCPTRHCTIQCPPRTEVLRLSLGDWVQLDHCGASWALYQFVGLVTGWVISRPRIGQSEFEIWTQCETTEGTLGTFRPDHVPEVTLECNEVLGSRIEDLCQNVLLIAVTLAHTYTSEPHSNFLSLVST